VPILITVDHPRYEGEFAPWFRRHQPDVVLSHFAEPLDWIKQSRPRAAETGFVLLNVIAHTQTAPCAGLDLQPRVIGRRAAELIVGQLLRNELGIPVCPSRTTILARWVEGPTVRPADHHYPLISRLPGLDFWQ
jgi:LacI family transcriptional regulator